MTSVARWLIPALLAALVACDAGRGLGESCNTTGDCSSDLQCLQQTCVPRCRAHVDCGDGARCNDDGECQLVESAIDDPCFSELECGVGQTCRLTTTLRINPGSCQLEGAGALEGESCTADDECRVGGCALGRCVSLCRASDDCRRGWVCAAVPLPARGPSVVNACLPGNATIEFTLEVPSDPDLTTREVLVPVPSTAQSMVLVFEAPTPNHTVGAAEVVDPEGDTIYRSGTLPVLDSIYYSNPIRHAPRREISVLEVPGSRATKLIGGVYTVSVLSFRDSQMEPSAAPPTLRVIEKLGSGVRLDLHFYFLDLAQHPCAEKIGAELSAATARTLAGFQTTYLETLDDIFKPANITLGDITYTDLQDLPEVGAGGRPEFDVLQSAQAPELFALPERQGGISVFFVRSMEPEGHQLLTGGTPGAPIPGTGASGIAVGLDTMCYRDWEVLARQTAHGLARHMGLFRNVEPDGIATHVDPITDSDDSVDNLMHWSEFGKTILSPGQREILRASPVLR